MANEDVAKTLDYLKGLAREAGGEARIVKTWRSGSLWYRQWSDGFVEQGGYIAHKSNSSVKITFNQKFSTKVLFVSFIPEGLSEGMVKDQSRYQEFH